MPRSAIHDGNVYIADDKNRMRIKPVTVLAEQGTHAIVAEGLESGDRVVLSDVTPVIDGLLLSPVETKSQPAGTMASQSAEAPK